MRYSYIGLIKNTSPLFQKGSLVYIHEKYITSYFVETLITGDTFLIDRDQLNVYHLEEEDIKLLLQNTPHLLDKFQKEIEALENTETNFTETLEFELFPVVEATKNEKIGEFKITEEPIVKEPPVNIKRLI